jgi:hypothetical protein
MMVLIYVIITVIIVITHEFFLTTSDHVTYSSEIIPWKAGPNILRFSTINFTLKKCRDKGGKPPLIVNNGIYVVQNLYEVRWVSEAVWMRTEKHRKSLTRNGTSGRPVHISSL